MKIKKYTTLIIILLLLFSLTDLWAQEEEQPADEENFEYVYGLGDQIFTIKAGLIFPLYLMSPDFNFTSTNLSMGGAGSLEWSAFINSSLALGGEFGGMFAFSPNDRVLYMMPLTFKISYFYRKYPFEFPIYCGAGISFNSIDDAFHLDFILKPGASVLWNFNSEWAFGFNLVYWWVPQIYTGNGDVPASHTRFGNFLETTMSALFHF
ncbi:MAG: hypothetical protein H7A26_02680 [Spirochaetales bacterium]|nr:hypothetical protein [Spirochaetales bacterium]